MVFIVFFLFFVVLVCGGIFLSVFGGNFFFFGYNGIRDYARNLDCEWIFSNLNRENLFISIYFLGFFFESY